MKEKPDALKIEVKNVKHVFTEAEGFQETAKGVIEAHKERAE